MAALYQSLNFIFWSLILVILGPGSNGSRVKNIPLLQLFPSGRSLPIFPSSKTFSGWRTQSQTLTVFIFIPAPDWDKAGIVKRERLYRYGDGSHAWVERSSLRQFYQHQVVFQSVRVEFRVGHGQWGIPCLLFLMCDAGLINSQSDFNALEERGQGDGKEQGHRTSELQETSEVTFSSHLNFIS